MYACILSDKEFLTLANQDHSQFADLLKNSEDNLFSLLSLFKETLVFIFDSRGRFTFGHSDSKSRLHTDPDHFLGKTVKEVMPDHVIEPFQQAFEINRKGKVAEFEYWMDMITHIGWFSATCSPIFREGVFEGTMAIVRDVTKEKTALESLRASEENFRTLVEMATMGIVIICEGIVVYTNPVTAEISGFSPSELIDQDFLDFIAPSERERVFSFHTKRLKGMDVPDVYELKMLRKNGNLIDVEVIAREITYKGKQSVQVLMQDITARKKSERELLSIQETLQEKVTDRTRELEQYRKHLEEIVEERTSRLRDTISLLRTEIEERMLAEERVEHLNQILKAIRNINQLITNETNVQKLINGACRNLVETRGYKDAWIFLVNSNGTFLTASEARYGEDLRPLMSHIFKGKYTPCLEKSLQAEGSWISDSTRSVCDQCPLRPNSDEPRRVMSCRLECHDRIYGVLTVTSLGEHAPDDEEISLFKEVCDDIAFALDSIEQQTGRKQAATALAESQNRYESLFENATAAILFLEEDKILECNSKCAEIFGATKNQLIGKTPYELSPPQQPNGKTSKEAAMEHISMAFQSGPQYFRWIHRKIDGELFPAEVGLNAIVINGRNYVQAVLMDTTSRENAENALRESEKSYRTLYNNVPVGLFRSDSTGRGKLIEVNPTMASMFGYDSPAALLNMESEKLFGARSSREQFIKAIMESGVLRDFITQMRRADGSEFWASISARSFNPANSNSVVIDGIIKDVSDTRQHENSLRESVESLQKAIEGTVSAMSLLVEMKDPYTSGHQKGVAHLACGIGREMGLDNNSIDCIRIASTLHDLGKLSIPTEILSKPGPLSEYEVEFLKTHPQAGYDILESIEFPWPIAKVILQHHERMDGSGYPSGLKGDEIMVEARIIAVADVVEATASRRPYRASKGTEVALEVIEDGAGTLFDPSVVRACISLFHEREFALLDHDSLTVGADFAI
jgi:PAS domain S-box-containing protein